MRIIQIHTSDHGGGAEIIAAELHQDFARAGHDCQFWVGRKGSSLPDVHLIDRTQRFKGEWHLRKWCEKTLGLQNFCSPGSLRLHQVLPEADVMVIHSMHGSNGYFNIEALPALSERQPTFLVLHDMWTMTGHCAYSLDCGRWQKGCGQCPDLTLSPSIEKDGTRLNWLRKKRAYAKSNFTIIPTAEWVADQVRSSPLLAQKQLAPVIHNSANPAIFHPADRSAARRELGIPGNNPLILFLANQGPRAHYKDFETLKEAFRALRASGKKCTLLAVGGEPDDALRAEWGEDIVFLPAQTERRRVALCYQAADIFCHITKADVCPLTIVEAMSCGTPVIGTQVGGVPELIEDGVNGKLVSLSDPRSLCQALQAMLDDPALRGAMQQAAAQTAQDRFHPDKRRDAYLDLFQNRVKEESL